MFFYTDTADAPWTIIKSNDKKRARLNVMRQFLSTLDYPGKDPQIALPPDALIVGRASHVVHASDHILASALHPELRQSAKLRQADAEAAAQPAADGPPTRGDAPPPGAKETAGS